MVMRLSTRGVSGVRIDAWLALFSGEAVIRQFLVRKWYQLAFLEVECLNGPLRIRGVYEDRLYRAASGGVQFDGVSHIHEIQPLK